VSGDFRYTFYPESWILNWRPQVAYLRNWTFDDVLQDEELSTNVRFEFSRNISAGAGYTRAMELFRGPVFSERFRRPCRRRQTAGQRECLDRR
jgi:hypothetical protein